MHFSVSCPACETEFPVDSDKVPADGIHAICSECERVFLVERPEEVGAFAEEPEAEVEATAWEDEEDAWGEEPEVAVADESEAQEEEDAALEDSWGAEEEEGSVSQVEELAETEEVQEFEQFFEPVLEDEVEEEEEVGEAAEVEEAATGWDEDDETAVEEDEPVEAEAPDEEPGGVEEEAPAPSGPRFGQRDPEEKAARLARVLVQDMIAYNRDLYDKALEQGTLKDDFEEEVRKSWEEYVDRIGEDMATSTTYFRDALNDILAKGETIFDGPP